ncbi:MAG: serine hydrolase [Flavobacteriaceae bacterium]|nr:serine hydrolase [Flavobacteriaceae bacterium]
MKKYKITFITALLFSFLSCAQVKNTTEVTNRINTYLSELETVGFSGTVLVELNGNKVISKGYGYSNKSKELKNKPSTIFSTGSITKQFTATAILKLEMQGKLSTDDNISKYFDNVPKDKSAITIHDLLRHQSGLKSNIGSDFDEISQTNFIDKVLNSSLIFENGTRFSYSNIGYSLLAIVVEKTSGKTYENYLYENLWKPAQMEFTGYSRPDFDTTKIAVGYYRDDRVWGKPTDKNWDTDAPYWHLKGNGGILSTTEDFYKWHKALMTEQILSKEAKQKLYHPKIRANETYNAIYAYGWDVSNTDRSTLRVWHNGTNNILYADFMRFIDEEVTLIMFSNKSHPNFDKLNQELSNIIFDKTYKPIIPIAENEVNKNFTKDIIRIILDNGLEVAKKEYKNRGNQKDLLENILNTKGYNLISENNLIMAIKIFEMNVFAFPKSANAFDSLAEAYMENGNKQFAIKYYEKSLELNPSNGNAIDMLKKLKTQ